MCGPLGRGIHMSFILSRRAVCPHAAARFCIYSRSALRRGDASGGPISFSSERNGGKNAAKNLWFLDFLPPLAGVC